MPESGRFRQAVGEVLAWSLAGWAITGVFSLGIWLLSARSLQSSVGLAALVLGILAVLFGAFGIHSAPVMPLWRGLFWTAGRRRNVKVRERGEGVLTATGIALFVAPQLLVAGAIMVGHG